MITVIILTFNEERHIARAIESVRPFATDVLLIDSYSTDRTIEIAMSLGARVRQNRFVNQADQFQWALNHDGATTEWVMRLDADEVVEPDLAESICRELPNLPGDVVGINLSRKHIFMGRWIRHGGRYPVILLRIWRRSRGRVEQRWMDEHIVVWGGRTVSFRGGFADHNLNDLSFFIDKHNKYATREAVEIIGQRRRLFPHDVAVSLGGSSRQASTKRFIKERLYSRVPFPFSILAYFFYRYFLELGFLDGREGLIYHSLQGLWYRFLVGAKVIEFERALRGLDDPCIIRAELAKLTGLELKLWTNKF